MAGEDGASDQQGNERPQSGDQEPLLHRADAGVRVGEAKEIEADRVHKAGPARKVLVEADAVDRTERRSDLVEADQDLELGLEADLRNSAVQA